MCRLSSKKHSKKIVNGFVLVSALFITLFMVMFAATAMGVAIFNQKSSLTFYQNVAAVKVAEAGLNYAMSRIQEMPGWAGCPGSSDEIHINPGKGVEVYEHFIKDDATERLGCVEGKLTMGDKGFTSEGFFDMYFAEQDDNSEMQFFRPDADAGPLPITINLCKNNSEYGTGRVTDDIPLKDSDEAPTGRTVLKNNIYVYCRGRVGNATRYVEAMMEYNPSEDTADLGSARKKINVWLHYPDEWNSPEPPEPGRIGFRTSDDGRPSILRAGEEITLGLLDDETKAKYAPLGFDYFDILAGSQVGARSSAMKPELLPPPDDSGKYDDNFQMDSAQSVDDALKMEDIMPNTSGFKSLPAGVYRIEPRAASDPEHLNSPAVWYCKFNTKDDFTNYLQQHPKFGLPYLSTDTDASHIIINKSFIDRYFSGGTQPAFLEPNGTAFNFQSGNYPDYSSYDNAARVTEYNDLIRNYTDEFAQRIDEGDMDWDYITRTLTFCKSHVISDETGLNNAPITSTVFYPERDYLNIQIGLRPVDEEPTPTVYLINNCSNGSSDIYVDGQLSGTGTLICNGKLDMNAESQLDKRSPSALGIYAAGDVTVHQIEEDLPYLLAYESADPTKSEELMTDYDLRNSVFYKVSAISLAANKSIEKVKQMLREPPYSKTEDEINTLMSTTYKSLYLVNIDSVLFTEEERRVIGEQGFDLMSYIAGDFNKDGTINESDRRTYLPVHVLDTEQNIINNMTVYDGTKPNFYPYRSTTELKAIVTKFYDTNKIKVENESPTAADVRDSILRGVVYTCKNFIVDTKNQSFIFDGSMIAFGGDINGIPSEDGGDINITASDIDFKFDTKNMTLLDKMFKMSFSFHYYVVH